MKLSKEATKILLATTTLVCLNLPTNAASIADTMERLNTVVNQAGNNIQNVAINMQRRLGNLEDAVEDPTRAIARIIVPAIEEPDEHRLRRATERFIILVFGWNLGEMIIDFVDSCDRAFDAFLENIGF